LQISFKNLDFMKIQDNIHEIIIEIKNIDFSIV